MPFRTEVEGKGYSHKNKGHVGNGTKKISIAENMVRSMKDKTEIS